MEKVFIRTNGTTEMNRKCVERLMKLGYKPVCDVDFYIGLTGAVDFGVSGSDGKFHWTFKSNYYPSEGCKELFLEERDEMGFTTKELLIIRTVIGNVYGNSKEVNAIYKKLDNMLEGRCGVKHTCTSLRGDIAVNEPDVDEIVNDYAEACAKHAEAETLRERIAKIKVEFEVGK